MFAAERHNKFYKMIGLLETKSRKLTLLLLCTGVLLTVWYSEKISNFAKFYSSFQMNSVSSDVKLFSRRPPRKEMNDDKARTTIFTIATEKYFWKELVAITTDASLVALTSKGLDLFSNIEKRSSAGVYTTVPDIQNQLATALTKAQEKEYIILIWEPPFGSKVRQVLNFANCGRCQVTYEKSKSTNPATKAIVFHFNELNIRNMPPRRRKDQYYIWWSMESPPALRNLRGMTLSQYDGVFNMTMSYRRDSDVLTAYGDVANTRKQLQNSGSGDPDKDINDLVAKKTKLALWVVSNCGNTAGARKRMDYTNQLIAAGLSLDRRGRCFPQNGAVPNIEIAKHYKFYLAFENGFHCKDYITEKLFRNALNMGAVPVVLGAPKPDYKAIVPQGSCIFVDDFETPSQLVEYLYYLDKNNTAYKEYFQWRTMDFEDKSIEKTARGFCSICRILHGINIDIPYKFHYETLTSIPLFGFSKIPRVVPSLRRWFYEFENRDCLPTY